MACPGGGKSSGIKQRAHSRLCPVASQEHVSILAKKWGGQGGSCRDEKDLYSDLLLPFSSPKQMVPGEWAPTLPTPPTSKFLVDLYNEEVKQHELCNLKKAFGNCNLYIFPIFHKFLSSNKEKGNPIN